MSVDRVSPERVEEIELRLYSDEADKSIEIADLIHFGRELVNARDDVANDLAEAVSQNGVLLEANRKLAEDLTSAARMIESARAFTQLSAMLSAVDVDSTRKQCVKYRRAAVSLATLLEVILRKAPENLREGIADAIRKALNGSPSFPHDEIKAARSGWDAWFSRDR